MLSKARRKKIVEKLNRAQKCSILGPQNLGSRGAPPGSAPVTTALDTLRMTTNRSRAKGIGQFTLTYVSFKIKAQNIVFEIQLKPLKLTQSKIYICVPNFFHGNCALFSSTRSRTVISFSLYHPPLHIQSLHEKFQI